MTVRRVMGIETEYGVLEPGRPLANAMAMSSSVVTAYAAVHGGHQARTRWDYADEDPLADARGFRLNRASAHPSMLTDNPALPAPSGDVDPDEIVAAPRREGVDWEDPSAATVVLTNGARLYVDHAHPEYAAPEVISPRDAVIWDRAGEHVMLAAARAIAVSPGMPPIDLYKNNVDGKGASYGTHENYLVDRVVPFGELAARITPYLVTRQVFCGAGRVGIGQHGADAGYQLSQRADYMEAEIGLETTLRRPIVNTRDEPHADATRWRRLHVIIGDANLLEVATWLKVGTASLVLWLIERAAAGDAALGARLDALAIVDPVDAVHVISHDPSLQATVRLADGRRMTAVQLQRELVAIAEDAVAGAGDPDEETAAVLARWSDVLTRLSADPMSCAREVEWVAKLRMLEGMRRREQLAWDHPRLAAFDLQWSDVRPERGIYHRLAAAGAVELLVSDAEVAAAVSEPPEDTRAYFRGRVVAKFGSDVSAASWDSVVFDIPGSPSLQRVPMRDPRRGSRASVGALIDASPDAAALLRALQG